MHRPVKIAHSSFIEGSHTTKNMASGIQTFTLFLLQINLLLFDLLLCLFNTSLPNVIFVGMTGYLLFLTCLMIKITQIYVMIINVQITVYAR